MSCWRCKHYRKIRARDEKGRYMKLNFGECMLHQATKTETDVCRWFDPGRK